MSFSSSSSSSSSALLAPLDRRRRREWFEFLMPWCGHGPSSAAYAMHERKHRNMLLMHIKNEYGGWPASMRL